MLHNTLRVLVAGSLLLGACGGDDQDAPGTSTFNGEMTGAHTATLGGQAVFGVTLDDKNIGSGFALILGDGGAARIFLTTPATTSPAVDTFEIAANDFTADNDTVWTGTVDYMAGGADEQFEIRGGTITLDRSNHNGVSGTFELRAQSTSSAGQVFITGSFNAAQINQEF